jgi:hypothetical protein
VIGELHAQIEKARHNLVLAGRAGLPYEAHLHRARLEDLLDRASRYGIDISDRVDRSLLPPPALTEGEADA